MITRPGAIALVLLALSSGLVSPVRAQSSTLPPDIRVGEIDLVVIGPGPVSPTIDELDTASGWARVFSERPELDGGWINLGQAMMIRHEPR